MFCNPLLFLTIRSSLNSQCLRSCHTAGPHSTHTLFQWAILFTSTQRRRLASSCAVSVWWAEECFSVCLAETLHSHASWVTTTLPATQLHLTVKIKAHATEFIVLPCSPLSMPRSDQLSYTVTTQAAFRLFDILVSLDVLKDNHWSEVEIRALWDTVICHHLRQKSGSV